jgi:spore cortex formation protein SpoVR/YcgB (stage V sporulation)
VSARPAGTHGTAGVPAARVRRPLSTSSEWTFELLERYDAEIGRIARDRYGLDVYRNQIEVIRSGQMIDAYASIGMPVGYHHWSFGKHFVTVAEQYRRGEMGLAYEIVINSDPCVAYLMEENSMAMQALVIAHACYGHNSFFKGNYLFRAWTDAGAIIDYLLFARNYVAACEEKHGVAAVERVLDACHALMPHGVDRYRRPQPLSAAAERARLAAAAEHAQRQHNDLWRTIPGSARAAAAGQERFPREPQENLLYFLEKHAPLLEPWEREVVRIVRKVAQYFYPQRQMQVMNEGWATFWHYRLLNDLYDDGLVDEGFMLEVLQYHTAVIRQPAFDSPHYGGINPYRLGFAIYGDIVRICTQPTEEDRRWFPDLAGADWRGVLDSAMRNYKDESFVLQFLSPRVMRDLRLFAVVDDDREAELEVAAIHDDAGYRRLRELLAGQYSLVDREPDVQVQAADLRGDRSLTLRHVRSRRRPLGDTTAAMLAHVHALWRFPVRLQSVDGDTVAATAQHPPAVHR